MLKNRFKGPRCHLKEVFFVSLGVPSKALSKDNISVSDKQNTKNNKLPINLSKMLKNRLKRPINIT